MKRQRAESIGRRAEGRSAHGDDPAMLCSHDAESREQRADHRTAMIPPCCEAMKRESRE